MASRSRQERAQAALDLLASSADTPSPQQSESEGQAEHSKFTDIIAGGLVALVAIPMCLSSSALIYSGDLSALTPVGIVGAFIGCSVVAAVISSFGSMPFAIGTVALEIGIILSYISHHVAGQITDPASIFPTVWCAVLLGTLCTGVCLLAIGCLGIGRWIRFMPYPVIAGFLAGMGWLAYVGSFQVMTGIPLQFQTLPELLTIEKLILWGPGALFAATLIAIRIRTSHHLVMPLLVTGWFVAFNAVCGIAAWFSWDVPDQYFFSSVSPAGFVDFLKSFDPYSVDWAVISKQVPLFAAMAILATSSILLYCSTLEVAWGANCDADRELRISGWACLVSSLLGGLAGHLSLGMSMLSYEAQGRTRLVGLTTSVCVLATLIVGMPLIAYYPKPVIGGLLIAFGMAMIAEYLVSTFRRLPFLEWLVIAAITGVIACIGLLEGVIVGILLSCVQFAVACSRQEVVKTEESGQTERSHVRRSIPQRFVLQREGEAITILELQGFLFFGVAHNLLDRVKSIVAKRPGAERFVIFDCSLVNGIDSSAVNSFLRMKQIVESSSVHIIFTNIPSTMLVQLEWSKGATEDEHYKIFAQRDEALEWCEERLLKRNVFRRARLMPIGVLLGDMQLDEKTSKELVQRMQRISLKQGDILLEQGQHSDSLYFIESGLLYESEGADEDHQRVQTHGPGMSVNAEAVVKPARNRTTIVAGQPTIVYRFSQEDFQRMKQECPDSVEPLLTFFVNLLIESERQGSPA